MARPPISGQWARENVSESVAYATASVWGTGINPIHAVAGEGPPLQSAPVRAREGEGQPAGESLPEELQQETLWGYEVSDAATQSTYLWLDPETRGTEGHPNWQELQSGAIGEAPSFPAAQVETPKSRATVGNFPSWDSLPELGNTLFRLIFPGSERRVTANPYGPQTAEPVDSLPSETVTEGWRHKSKGDPADSMPSDVSQVFVTTSDEQRYKVRNNNHAVARNTDDPRSDIPSRVIGQRLKVYSEGERHYDMTPKRQDIYLRGFWLRTAGTAPPGQMAPNEMYVSEPIERVPPPDPSLGSTETEYGFTGEDQQYYG